MAIGASDSRSVGSLFDQAEAAFGGIDVVACNAGLMLLAPLAETTDEVFDRQVAINLRGAFNTLREASRRVPDGGRIIGLSTSIVATRLPAYGAYAATKAALEAMCGVLANELRGRGI